METIIAISVGIFALAASFITSRASVQQLLFTLIGVAVIWNSRLGFGETDPALLVLWTLAAILLIGLLSGFLMKKYGEWIALAGTLLAFLFFTKKATYFDFELVFNAKIVLLVFLGGLIPVISNLKGVFISKWFHVDVAAITGSVSVFFAGLLVFYATFQAQYFGVLLLGTGWLSISFTANYRNFTASGIALLSLGLLFAFLKTHPGIDTSFLRGNFLMGLVLGAGAIAWVAVAKDMDRFRWIFTFVVPLLIVFAAIMMGKANENFGGLPAYAGALLGASVLLFTKRNAAFTVPFQGMLIALSVVVLQQFAPKRGPEKKSRIDKTVTSETTQTKASDILDITAIQLKPEMEGKWKSVLEGSKIEFKLGPEGGITTGAIQKFDVGLKVNSSGEPEQLDVSMSSTSLTTFNELRDESVLSADFLNTPKFKTMKYTSSGIKKENDRYFVTGNFTMLGVTQPLNLELKFAASGMEKSQQYLVMVGKSSLDRTKFGMEGDAKIGNVVDVNFEIELRK